MTKANNTNFLNEKILKSTDIKQFLNEHKEDILQTQFCDALYVFLETKKMKNSDFFKRAGINESYGYQLLSGKRQPSRNKVIQVAIGLSLTVMETNQLLRLAEKSELYVRNKRDAIVTFSLNNNMSLMDVNTLLYDENCDIID